MEILGGQSKVGVEEVPLTTSALVACFEAREGSLLHATSSRPRT